jgi:hypothetical protein
MQKTGQFWVKIAVFAVPCAAPVVAAARAVLASCVPKMPQVQQICIRPRRDLGSAEVPQLLNETGALA